MKRYYPTTVTCGNPDDPYERSTMTASDNGYYVEYEEAQAAITALQAQLAERDKLLEQYRADRLESDAIIYWTHHWTKQIGGGVYSLDELLRYVNELLDRCDNLSALEANDREVRIKCLEDAADKLGETWAVGATSPATFLPNKANELKV